MSPPSLSTLGALQEGDLYIERPADAELLRALQNHEYAYVLASRQTGKTSLMSRTLRKLEAQGVRCVKLDMGTFSFEGTLDNWYLTIAREIALWLGQPGSFAETSFARSGRRTPIQRFSRFLQEAVALSDAPLVIFLDEVESFLKVPGPVADGFLTAIRSYVNDRERTPAYRRLCFCLMGVCSPTELIQDERRTPFNVARGIPLEDFEWESVRASFLPLFPESAPQAEAALARVYHFTEGHPYMTHRLCKELLEPAGPARSIEPATVDRLVQEIFLGSMGREQESLLEVERRFCIGQPHRVQRRLALYRSLLRGETVLARGHDPAHLELRLTGLAKERHVPGHDPQLVVRNPIFSSIFHAAWQPQTQPAKLDPALWIKEQTQRWIEFGRLDAFVLYGEELREAQTWAERQRILDPQADEFLVASKRADARERSLRLNSLLLTILLSSLASFLLSQFLPTYWHQRGYPFEAAVPYLYGLAFVLSLPSGLLADRQRLESVNVSLGGFGLILAGALLLFADCFVHSSLLALAAVTAVACGQSICRPHQAVLLGSLFPHADRRLGAAFLVFYATVNVGALLGPLVGTALLRSYGWVGPIVLVCFGYGMALAILGTARHAFERGHLLHQTEAADAPRSLEPAHSAPRPLLLLATVTLLFWAGFYSFGTWNAGHPPIDTPNGGTAQRVLLQSLSLDTLTTLFVIGMAPLFIAWERLAAKRKWPPHVTLRTAGAMALVALVLARMLLRLGTSVTPLGDYLLLSLAELLFVPVSMSLVAAFSPPKLQCTTMGSYYFLIGVAVWIPKLVPMPTAGSLAFLASSAALGAVWVGRSRWDTILDKLRVKPTAGSRAMAPSGRPLAAASAPAEHSTDRSRTSAPPLAC